VNAIATTGFQRPTGKDGQSDRTVIACMDDGVMPMNGLNVMITISKHWEQ
jgi:hypothetical protein